MANNETSNASDDAIDQLKKRARRRLVGAIALVLFAVITLPLVMDHEPRPAGPEIQVRIPSQDAPIGDKRAGNASGVRPTPSNGASGTSVKTEQAATAEDVPPSVRSEPVPVSKGQSKAETPPEAKTEVPDAKSPKADAPKPEVKKDAKSELKLEAKADTRQKAEADAARASAALSAGSGGEYVVQLGAYQEAGRVKILLAKIKELGLPAFTEKVDTPQGPRTRVRAGPFPSREAAEKAQERVKIIGVSGPVAPK